MCQSQWTYHFSHWRLCSSWRLWGDLPTDSTFICCLTNNFQNHAKVSSSHSRDGFTQKAESFSHLQELNTQRLESARIKSWLEIPTPILRCTFTSAYNIRPLPFSVWDLTIFRKKPGTVSCGSLTSVSAEAGRSLQGTPVNKVKRKYDPTVTAVESFPENS